jgi:hypothetical protein
MSDRPNSFNWPAERNAMRAPAYFAALTRSTGMDNATARGLSPDERGEAMARGRESNAAARREQPRHYKKREQPE